MYSCYIECKITTKVGIKSNIKKSIGETFRTSLASRIPITDDTLESIIQNQLLESSGKWAGCNDALSL